MKTITESMKLLINDICAEFHLVSNSLKHCCQIVNNSNDFKYPIIIASYDETNLGVPAILKGDLGNKLLYTATYLEYLVMLNIIQDNEIESFKKNYDSQSNHCCFMALEDKNVQVLYLAYK